MTYRNTLVHKGVRTSEPPIIPRLAKPLGQRVFSGKGIQIYISLILRPNQPAHK